MKLNQWVLFSCLVFAVACSTEQPGEASQQRQRGEILQAELLSSLNRAEVKTELNKEVPSSFQSFFDPEFGVDLYKVLYHTIDPNGGDYTASGLVIVPKGPQGPVPIASYQHGTIAKKSRAPSRGLDATSEVTIGLVLGGDGMLTCLPDYLGLGDGEGLHPYIHAESEASAAIDLIKAARTLANEKGVQSLPELYLLGYSQGGHATMALHKVLEREYEDEFLVKASAPMAGPYSLSEVMARIFMSDQSYGSPSYLPYVLLSFNQVYGLYDKVSDFLVEPYASTVPALFDGTKRNGEIDARLPAVPREMLQPERLRAFEENPNDEFRKRLIENDLDNWLPKAPMKLYHCEGDELVSIDNAYKALANFKNMGKEDVELIVIDAAIGTSLSHGDCALISLFAVRNWFQELLR